MWQPFNGLQIFTPGNWHKEITEEGQQYLAELAADGKTAPKAALPKGSTFRIKCGEDGFNKAAAQTPKAEASDLKRARTKIPRAPYKGETFEAMSTNLNKWLLKQAPKSRACEDFSVEELQRLQVMLFMLRDPQLDGVYQQANDARRIRKDIMNMSSEWDQLNSMASHDPDLARMHRDGHCHEAVMWYVHHLPAAIRENLKDEAILPLLPRVRHNFTQPHAEPLRRAYEEKVSCASCHSFVYPSTAIVV
jgi:hypothetical protein